MVLPFGKVVDLSFAKQTRPNSDSPFGLCLRRRLALLHLLQRYACRSQTKVKNRFFSSLAKWMWRRILCKHNGIKK